MAYCDDIFAVSGSTDLKTKYDCYVTHKVPLATYGVEFCKWSYGWDDTKSDDLYGMGEKANEFAECITATEDQAIIGKYTCELTYTTAAERVACYEEQGTDKDLDYCKYQYEANGAASGDVIEAASNYMMCMYVYYLEQKMPIDKKICDLAYPDQNDPLHADYIYACYEGI